MNRTTQFRLAGALTLSLSLSMAGCGAVQTPSPADPAQARQALHDALDAWQGGGTLADLAQRPTPIHVADHDWANGFRLQKYRAADEGKLAGFDLNIPVDLELKGPKGKVRKTKAVYTVTTSPKLLVLRQDAL